MTAPTLTSTYIEVGAETGLGGLVLWCMLVFGGIVRFRKMRRKVPKTWRTGDPEQRFMYDAPLYMSTSLVGFALTSLFVSFAWLDIIYILVMFQAGLTLAIRSRLARDAAQQSAAMVPVGPPPPLRPALLPTA